VHLPPAAAVTLAVVNARVWTGAPRRPWADAVVVRGDRLALVGGSAEARKLAAGAPGARVVDAGGRTLVARVGDGAPGTLAAGDPASFVLVDGDLPPVAPNALGALLRDAPVALAVSDGRVVGESDG
jgi:predicted amidohydrolase YtcJ